MGTFPIYHVDYVGAFYYIFPLSFTKDERLCWVQQHSLKITNFFLKFTQDAKTNLASGVGRGGWDAEYTTPSMYLTLRIKSFQFHNISEEMAENH